MKELDEIREYAEDYAEQRGRNIKYVKCFHVNGD